MSIVLKDTQIKNLQGIETVLVGGCFDIIHPAHKKFLRLSKKTGGKLVILLESDKNIKKLKGKDRPLNTQLTRAENLSKLSYVDYIILLKMPESSSYYYNLVKSLRPAIIAVTSNDPLLIDKKKQAELVGGKVVEVMKRDTRHSTTKKIEEKKQ